MEGKTIAVADRVLVNSTFTADKFVEAFPNAKRKPAVLYPGVTVSSSTTKDVIDAEKLPWPK